MEPEKMRDFREKRSFQEFYFLAIALLLAFGTLQTIGGVLETEKPAVTVVSCSMYPELKVGDLVLVHGEKFSEIDKQDILIYKVGEVDFDTGENNVELTTYQEDSDSISYDGETIKIVNPVSTRSGAPRYVFIKKDGEFYTREDGSKAMRVGDEIEVSNETWEIENVQGSSIPIIHRVIEKNENSLETHGDNNPGQLDFEKNVTPEQIYGKQLLTVPRIGLVKILAMDLVGFNGDRPLAIDNTPRCTVN